MLRRIVLGLVMAAGVGGTAQAQSGCPTIINGAVLTAAQWNNCFGAKQDALGYVPLNKAGDVMLGKLTTAPSGAGAGLNVGIGTTPSSLQNGDVWLTNSGLFYRLGGTTVQIGAVGANTWTTLQQFTDGNFSLLGATSGSLKLHAASVSATSSITFPAGTTDFSATGGASNVVKQASSGAPLTVGTLGFSDLTGSATVAQGAASSYGLTNCSITASVTSNNLTVALKDAGGSDPSASSPCVINYHNSTAATGSWSLVQTTAATSFVANSGSTFGITNTSAQCVAASSCPFRLWVVAINSGSGTVLGVVALSNAGGVRPLRESSFVTTTACNACNTATAIGTIYSTATQTTKPIAILGYLEWGSGLGTAGAYASGPTLIQTMGPGVRRPGDVVQTLQTSSTSATSTTSSGGVATNLSGSITPSSAANPVVITWSGPLVNNAGGSTTADAYVVRSSTVIGNVIGIWAAASSVTISRMMLADEWMDTPGSAAALSYVVNILSTDNTTTVTFCALPGGIAGPSACRMTLKEIMG